MVLVADEARVKKESDLTSIWYPKGKYPEIRVDQKKDALSFYGALNVISGKAHIMDSPKQTSLFTVRFLETLECIYKGKDVLLLWDGAPRHRGEVKKYLRRKNKEWKLHIEYFPAYSPDLNPQEHVWKETRKHTTHNSEEEFEDKCYEFYSFIKSHKFNTDFLQKYA